MMPPERAAVAALHFPKPVETPSFGDSIPPTHGKQGGGGLEFKALKQRQVLGGGVGPGTAETFKKVKSENSWHHSS